MDRRSRPLRLLVPVVMAAAVALAGCGGDDGDDGATRPPTTQPSASSVSPTTSPSTSPAVSPTGSPPASTAPSDPAVSPTTRPTGTARPPQNWSSEPVAVARQPVTSALLVGLRSAHHEEGGMAYDRLVLEFAGSPPSNYQAGYVDQVLSPGSGAPLPLRGQAKFEVVLHPAAAHDEEGQSTMRTPTSGGGHPALVSYAMAGDFEGYVHIGLGLDDVVGFRVTELSNPTRIVIDFAA